MLRLVGSLLRLGQEFVLIDTLARTVRLLVIYAALALAASVLSVAALACAMAALWIWAERPLGHAGAPLLVAGVLVLICIGIGLAMRSTLRSRRTRRAAGPAPAMSPSRLLNAAAQGFMMGLNGAGARRE